MIARITDDPAFELRYDSLFRCGHGFSFPCDARGHVDLDGFSERLRCNYFYVRALVGREFTAPCLARREAELAA